jgi:cyclopropane-fatty-acyl-phospholipid synthase
VAEVLGSADIRIDGDRPWDPQVHDERLFQRVLAEGGIGAGESYMDGWWDAERLDEFFTKLHSADPYKHLLKPRAAWLALKGKILNLQTKTRSGRVAQEHYDLGNDLYEAMLGLRMQYAEEVPRGTEVTTQPEVFLSIARQAHLRAGVHFIRSN